MHHPSADEESDDRRFKIFALAGAAVLFAVLMWLRFDYTPDPPRVPRRPSPVRAADITSLNYDVGLYRAALDQDAAKYGVPVVGDVELTSPFPREAIDIGKEIVPGGEPIETATLRISLRSEALQVDTGRGSYGGEHLILRVENKTDKHLAYRVDTGAGQRCSTKGDLAHNALALAPGEAVERTECVRRDGTKLVVERVETLQVPALSYHYVSRLYPPHIAMDTRATRGHRPPKGEVCNAIPEQSIRLGMGRKEVTWRDVVDFYARHSCETYIFPPGYKAFETKDQYRLPVSREAAATSP